MSRYPRKILSNTYIAPTTTSAVGVYNIVEQFQAKTGNNWPLLPFLGGNQSVTDLDSLGGLMTFAVAETPTAGGTLTVNSVALGSYDYTIKNSSQTVSSFTNSDWFTSTEDTRSAIIAINGNLTINSGITFVPSNRKLFTFIYVSGNLTLNGTISMSNKGANHSGSGNSGGATTAGNVRIYTGTAGGVSNPQIPATGGAGAAPQGSGCPGSPSNPAGTSGTAGGTGGGGGGGTCGTAPYLGGSGTAGTSFSGGGGGGGKSNGYTTNIGGTAVANGGAGGAAVDDSGGGAGQPGGAGSGGGATGGTGLGGVVIIICKGTISGSGTISATGTRGGSGGAASGGSGGGGSINIICLTNSSSYSLDASGGSLQNSNPYGRNGGAGGTGTARILTT
jgi:hypothetical protein